jgi:hypothetical protein
MSKNSYYIVIKFRFYLLVNIDKQGSQIVNVKLKRQYQKHCIPYTVLKYDFISFVLHKTLRPSSH